VGVAAMCALLGIWLTFWYTNRIANAPFFVTGGSLYFPFLAWPVYLSLLLTSSAAFAGERERATWDAVLTSPLEGREIVLGKMAGALWDVRWWLVALALYCVLVFLQGIYQQHTVWGAVTSEMPIPLRILRSFGLMITGMVGGSPGLVGLASELLFVLGVGLHTSIRSSTSGKSLAMALLIWIGSSVVFWIAAYIFIAIAAVVFFAVGGRYVPSWSGPYVQAILMQLMWAGPMLIGIFWGAIGIWLIRRTVVRFDDLASRMATREVVPLEGLPTELTGAP
jgi:hypothetical protein